jgi:hypothetical protein
MIEYVIYIGVIGLLVILVLIFMMLISSSSAKSRTIESLKDDRIYDPATGKYLTLEEAETGVVIDDEETSRSLVREAAENDPELFSLIQKLESQNFTALRENQVNNELTPILKGYQWFAEFYAIGIYEAYIKDEAIIVLYEADYLEPVLNEGVVSLMHLALYLPVRYLEDNPTTAEFLRENATELQAASFEFEYTPDGYLLASKQPATIEMLEAILRFAG